MKELFEQVRKDRTFNLELLTYRQLFNGLKDGIAKAISKFSNQNISVNSLVLNEDRCSTRYAYANDKNLYPKIYLSIKGFYDVVLTPFEIELLELKSKVRFLSDWELSECFYEFMCEQFPDCNYEKFYEKYQKDSEIVRKTSDKCLFL